MRRISELMACVLIFLAPALALAAETPYELLARALMREGAVNVEAVVRISDWGGKKQTVKMVSSTDGRTRLTVLLPIEQAGTEVLLLGDTTEIYEPDSHQLHITSSPGGDPVTYAKRLKLLRENYLLTIETGLYLAGQHCVQVTAKAKNAQLGAVNFYIDPQTACVLRVEYTMPGEGSNLYLETLHVDFPAQLPDDAFEPKLSNATIVKDSVPVIVSSRSKAKRLLGVAPLIPGHLPIGFQLARMYFSETKLDLSRVTKASHPEIVGVPALVIEITDGIQSATLHEIPLKKLPASVRAQLRKQAEYYAEIGDVAIVLRGEMGRRAQKAVMAGLKDLRSQNSERRRPEFGLFRLNVIRGGSWSPMGTATVGAALA